MSLQDARVVILGAPKWRGRGEISVSTLLQQIPATERVGKVRAARASRSRSPARI